MRAPERFGGWIQLGVVVAVHFLCGDHLTLVRLSHQDCIIILSALLRITKTPFPCSTFNTQ